MGFIELIIVANMNHDISAPVIQLLNQHYLSNSHPQIATRLWLIGTSHCHLCELAEEMLKQCQKVLPFDYVIVDIVDIMDLLQQSDGMDNTQCQKLAQSIPILVSKTDLLPYPFGVLEIQKMLKNVTNN